MKKMGLNGLNKKILQVPSQCMQSGVHHRFSSAGLNLNTPDNDRYTDIQERQSSRFKITRYFDLRLILVLKFFFSFKGFFVVHKIGLILLVLGYQI